MKQSFQQKINDIQRQAEDYISKIIAEKGGKIVFADPETQADKINHDELPDMAYHSDIHGWKYPVIHCISIQYEKIIVHGIILDIGEDVEDVLTALGAEDTCRLADFLHNFLKP